ncbi:MAG: CBS domain-containing protein [Nitrososphaerota archaeon]|nr:CBS domain-containing protein [Nitrososphaerota archaeon]MDG7022382.1 CBS domain-containing protein [Nitrososphaerota archaeon]
MRIKEALPDVFKKLYPLIEPKTQVLPAMSLLRFHEIDALPFPFVASKSAKTRPRAVYGFSSLARIMALKPGQFGPFLRQPCEVAAERLSSVSASGGLGRLLDVFAKTRFGFALVEDGRNLAAFAGLPDILPLYASGTLATSLTARDVGSPILSVPRQASLRQVLTAMFEHRYRRVFLAGSDDFVSDRGIIGHIFKPATLNEMANGTEDILDISVSEVESMRAHRVASGTPVEEAARMLKETGPGQCLVFDRVVVTPWDVVMKPWNSRKLTISAS